MRRAEEITRDELKELLSKCWMTHDAMWFFHSATECGMEKTNKINKAAVRAMAAIEIKRVKKLLAPEDTNTYDGLKEFILQAKTLIMTEFMKFDISLPGGNTIVWNAPECFAYEGVKKIGAAGAYQCGIIDRVSGWLDGLGVKHAITPEITTCLMHTQGKCSAEFQLDLNA